MKCVLQILLFIKILSITIGQSETSSDYDFEEDFPLEEIDKKLKNEGSEEGSSPVSDPKEQADDDACDEPILPEHAKVSKGDGAPYLVGDTVSYSCDFGYSADGASHTSTCVKSAYRPKASWTNTTIICNPRSCGDPGYVPNARRIGSLFTFPNSISFECDEGYERRGSSVHYCQVNGKWSGALPSCEKLECDVPEDPLNGRVTYTSLEYASELTYECDKGFVLRNYEPRICSENGTWSGDEPICQESQCETPVAPIHGSVRVVGDARRVGSMALYTCDAGLVLVGSAVSKCLDIGQWTFPTPKCVAPCSVPVILNGYIGKYENRRGYYQREFKTVAPNKSLEDDEELYLRCDNKYEPLGKPASEVKISCAQGIWKEDPICMAEKCRSQPPQLENARITRFDNEHNGITVYHCKTFYNKTKQGNVTCVFGQWKGNPPTCSDTRCYLEKLPHPGVIGQRNVYQSGETLVPTCQKGYTKADAVQNISCNSGKWIVAASPCIPADCLKRPPSQPNGHIKSHSQQHGSKVVYECNEPFKQQTSSEVRCQLGEWVGSPPQCRDSRCYYKDLKTRNGIAHAVNDPTDNGQVLQFQCLSGYHMTNSRPRCSGGIWMQDDTSPCQNDCQVLKIDNGEITEIRKVTIDRGWFRRAETKEEIKPVKINTVVSRGSSLYVSCYEGYSFAGQGTNHIQITCSQGSWTPNPVCSNSKVVKETVTRSRPVAEPESSTLSVNRHFVTPSVTSSYAEPDVHPLVENCVCTYQGSDDLIAYVGNETLPAGSTVDPYTVITFQCKKFGIQRLKGASSVVCVDCESWSTNKLPDCINPTKGDTILMYNDDHLSLLPNGLLRVMKGTDVHINCYALGYHDYPTWSTTRDASNARVLGQETTDARNRIFYSSTLEIKKAGFQNNAQYTCQYNEKFRTIKLQVIGQLSLVIQKKSTQGGILKVHKGVNVDVSCYGEEAKDSPIWVSSVNQAYWYQHNSVSNLNVYRSKLMIQNAAFQHNGVYNCTMEGYIPKSIIIQVAVECPKYVENEEFMILYDRGQKVNSIVVFSCTDPNKELVGFQSLTCLSDGRWSGEPPRCVSKSSTNCPMFNKIEGLKVEYSNGLATGSYATFHCSSPREKKGESRLRCLRNGQWSGPAPSCTLPAADKCILADLSKLLPLKVKANTRDIKEDTLPLGFELRLSCKENMTPAKPAKAKCGSDGQWQIPEVECVSTTFTCQPPVVPVESTVIVSPLKYSYNFGESLTFSCTPGEVLSVPIETAMCLQNGWSPSSIPDCINVQ